jgi:WD40 repeat protein
MQPIDELLIPTPAFTPDGRQVAWGGLTGQIAIFDVASGRLLRTLTPPPATAASLFIGTDRSPSYVGRLAFSPDGTRLASGALETATLFDVDSGEVIATVDGWRVLATNVSFVDGGNILAVSGFDGTTHLFSADTGARLGPAIGDAETPAYQASPGPPGVLITSDFGGHVRLVDLTTRSQVGALMTGRPVPVSTTHLLPGGRELLAGFHASPGEVQLFDVESGQPIGDPFPSRSPYGAASPSPDGTSFVTGDGTGMIRWELDPDAWRRIACEAAGRNLTMEEWAQYLPPGEPYRATCPGFDQ